MIDLSFQSYNAIPDFFQTKLLLLSFIFLKIRFQNKQKEKISHWQKQTKKKNISLAGLRVMPIYLHLPHQILSLSLLFLSQAVEVIFLQLAMEIFSVSSFSLWLWRSSLSLLFFLVCVFNLYSTDIFFPRFSICIVLGFFFFLYNHYC